jgi:hypothetical protein
MMLHQVLRRFGAAAAVGVLAIAVAAPAARASFTAISAPTTVGEDTHEKILENIYGGNFVKSGVNYSNGTVNVLRIDDSMTNNGVLGMVDGGPGTASDQIWHDGFTDAFAKVRYAKDNQAFGYWEGTSGGTYQKLFDVSGTGYAVSGGTLLADMRGKSWRWGRSRYTNGQMSSLPTENVDDADHMVTYQVQGLPNSRGQTVWLLFWEDRNLGDTPNTGFSDRDINDLVVELRASGVVPEPATIGLAGVALGAVALRRRRRI